MEVSRAVEEFAAMSVEAGIPREAEPASALALPALSIAVRCVLSSENRHGLGIPLNDLRSLGATCRQLAAVCAAQEQRARFLQGSVTTPDKAKALVVVLKSLQTGNLREVGLTCGRCECRMPKLRNRRCKVPRGFAVPSVKRLDVTLSPVESSTWSRGVKSYVYPQSFSSLGRVFPAVERLQINLSGGEVTFCPETPECFRSRVERWNIKEFALLNVPPQCGRVVSLLKALPLHRLAKFELHAVDPFDLLPLGFLNSRELRAYVYYGISRSADTLEVLSVPCLPRLLINHSSGVVEIGEASFVCATTGCPELKQLTVRGREIDLSSSADEIQRAVEEAERC